MVATESKYWLGLVRMPGNPAHTCATNAPAGSTLYFRWLAIAIICIALFASFRIGLVRGLADSIGQSSWGRVLFAVGAAITEMEHGGYGYTTSNVIETVLTYSGLTSDPGILAPLGTKFPDNLQNTALMNAAIDKAVHFKWPFDPNDLVRGSSGDDLGLIDYVRLSFYLFGYRISSLYFTYFVILGISVSAFVNAFRTSPARLALIALICVVHALVFGSLLLNPEHLGAVADPRFLSVLSVIPGLHLSCLMLDRLAPSPRNAALALLQSVILIFIVWTRTSAIWVLLGVSLLAGTITIHDLRCRQFRLLRLWSIGILFGVWACQAIYVSVALHPVYNSNNEITHHVLWHSLFYPLQFHPKWNERYADQYDNAVYDELPPTAAKKYLLRHPPSNPDAIYLTADHKYLRLAAAELYIRKAFFEFLSNDPKFVLEALFVYNPLTMIHALTSLLASTSLQSVFTYLAVGTTFFLIAGFLIAVNARWRPFENGVWLLTAGFVVSLLPVLPTIPNVHTMADQYLMLLVMLGGWAILGIGAAMRACAGALAPSKILPQ
jgi:hypothetical protein